MNSFHYKAQNQLGTVRIMQIRTDTLLYKNTSLISAQNLRAIPASAEEQ